MEEIVLKLTKFRLSFLFFKNINLSLIGQIQEHNAHQASYSSKNTTYIITKQSKSIWCSGKL